MRTLCADRFGARNVTFDFGRWNPHEAVTGLERGPVVRIAIPSVAGSVPGSTPIRNVRLELLSSFISALVVVAAAVLFPLQAFCQQVDDRISIDAADWPWWRGPQRNGVANPDQDPPT